MPGHLSRLDSLNNLAAHAKNLLGADAGSGDDRMELIFAFVQILADAVAPSIAREVADALDPVQPPQVRRYWWLGWAYLGLGIGGFGSLCWFMPIRSSLVVVGGLLLSFGLVLAGGVTLEVAATLNQRSPGPKRRGITVDEWLADP